MTANVAATAAPHTPAEPSGAPQADHTGRAPQDVQHSLRLLADRQHRHLNSLSHRRSDPEAPADELTYSTFATAIRFPVVVILPLIAILAITSEWSQRTGLTTFTLIPRRGRIIAAKAISAVLIAVAAMVLTFAVGALGNVLGAAATGSGLVWDVSLTQCSYYILGMVLSLMTGFMLAVTIRSSTGSIVAYFVLTFVLPTVFGLLATSQQWFHELQPWIDIQFAQSGLFVFDQALTGEQWAHIGVTGVTWLLLPLAIGLRFVMRAEVK